MSSFRAIVSMVVIAVVGTACAGSGGSVDPLASPGVASTTPGPPSPSASLSRVSASPTGPSLSPLPEAGSAQLLIRMITCDDVCVEDPGTTVLEDGRVIWLADDASFTNGRGLVERRLTPDGLATVRAAVDATGLLSTDGTYEPVKVSAVDTGHGFTSYAFQHPTDAGVARVTAVDPAAFDADNERHPGTWKIPDEARRIADLGGKLEDPVAWLPETAWAEPTHRYAPAAWLLIVEASRPGGDEGPFVGSLDVDAVDWPFLLPLTSVGKPYAVDGQTVKGATCAPVAPEVVAAMSAAEQVAEARIEPDDPMGRVIDAPWDTRTYGWATSPGTALHVTTRMLLPDQPISCEGGGRW